MASASSVSYVRKRGFEDFYLAGSLELKGGALLGGDLDMAGFSILNAGSGGPEITTFTGLDDTPASYAGQAGLFPRVNLGESALEFVAGAGDVDSVFGRIGVVVAAASDYDASQIDNDSGVAGAAVSDALDTLLGLIVPVAPVDSVFGRTGAVAAVASDYDASQVDNDSGVAGATVSDALDALAAAGVSFPLRAPLGFSSAPPYSFADSTNSGMFWQSGILTLQEGGGGGKFISSDGIGALLSLPTTLNMKTLSQRVEFLTALVGAGTEPQAASGTMLVYEGGSTLSRTLILSTVNLGAVVTYVNNGAADLTVNPQGGDAIINSGATVGFFTVEPGHSVRLCATAASKWTVICKT